MNYHRIYFRLIIFFSILTWCTGFTLNVLTNGSEVSAASIPLLNFFYDNVCHQDEDKLISLSGFNFLVCARCSGIYFGALISSLFLLISFKKKEDPLRIFSIASIILFADVILNNFLLSSYNKISAFITGLFFGSVCFLIILNQIEELNLTKAKS
ncbi:MAG: hypothetical protein A2V93_10320 [Ignavibacteria bacterium RBG_16_34_14]|nr:MAG: hypothetical protein A2V93_10320 [Ignavibacteria bacterium RBG_16_34_14]